MKVLVCPRCKYPFVVGEGNFKRKQKYCSRDCKKSDIRNRFLKFVDKRLKNGCWLWTGTRHGKGYGHFQIGKKSEKAHRFSYLEFVGPLNDKHVLHKCDNPPCVNPKHLFLGTNLDNVRDKLTKGRQPYGNTMAHTKVTDRDVLLIRALWSSKTITQRDIAARFGISITHTYCIATKRRRERVLSAR